MTAHNGNPVDSPQPAQCGEPNCYMWTPHTHYGPNVTLSQPVAQTPPTPAQASEYAEAYANAILAAFAENPSATEDEVAERIVALGLAIPPWEVRA